MPLQNDKNTQAFNFSEGFSLTKYKYVVEYRDKYNENASWERCIAQHETFNACMQEYSAMERADLWTLRIVKIAITETTLYMD